MRDLFFWILAAATGVAIIQQWFTHSRQSQRRVYWTCAGVAVVASLIGQYPDWSRGLGVGAAVFGGMAVAAYAYTPYIKINGRIYALTVDNSRPDPGDVADAEKSDDAALDPAPNAYSGMLTATKLWWLVVGTMVVASGNTIAFVTGDGEWWVAAIGIAFLLFMSVALGFGDASWGYPVARAQKIQFWIATVITAGTFAALYSLAYSAAKRRPVRRTRSMEYRAHPRHRKSD